MCDSTNRSSFENDCNDSFEDTKLNSESDNITWLYNRKYNENMSESFHSYHRTSHCLKKTKGNIIEDKIFFNQSKPLNLSEQTPESNLVLKEQQFKIANRSLSIA